MVAITWGPEMKPDVRRAAQQRWVEHRHVLEKQKLTAEEKTRWAEFMHTVWQAIGSDAESSMMGERMTNSIVVELVCDANRLTQFSDMTADEEAFLSAIYARPSFQKWARSVLNYY